jgi:hypothetical protein
MSTQTKLGFATVTVEKVPSLACVGKVVEVGEGKLSKAETYVVQPIIIRGNGANRQGRVNMLYRPEWFDPSFDPDSIKTDAGEQAKGMVFVYQRNIVPARGSKKLSVLQGLAGTPERFDDLSARLLGATYDENMITQVRNILNQFLVAEGEDVQIGYKLVQATEDTGEFDEKGKKVKALKEGYEVGDFFYPIKAHLVGQRAYAKKNPDKLQIAFDED